MKSALITGVTGQDGAYLAALLLGKGYRVIGGVRRASTQQTWRLSELGALDHPKLRLVELDITDLSALMTLMEAEAPDEVYNLAAQSSVSASFTHPVATGQVTGIGAVNLLEAIRQRAPKARFYQASTSEIFGYSDQARQDEKTPLRPQNPYAAAKAYAHQMTEIYREGHGIFAASGILFNHESELRGEDFVTRKIAMAAARIALGLQEDVALGNLNARRDWGFAGEYVEGMHAMLQLNQPGSYVLATGQANSVRDFAAAAFDAAGLPLTFSGAGRFEVGHDATGRARLRVDGRLYRPVETACLIGDASRAKADFGWRAKTDMTALCTRMVEAEFARLGHARAQPGAARAQ